MELEQDGIFHFRKVFLIYKKQDGPEEQKIFYLIINNKSSRLFYSPVFKPLIKTFYVKKTSIKKTGIKKTGIKKQDRTFFVIKRR